MGFGVICLIVELVGKYVFICGFVFYKVFLVVLIQLLFRLFVNFACKSFRKFYLLQENTIPYIYFSCCSSYISIFYNFLS